MAVRSFRLRFNFVSICSRLMTLRKRLFVRRLPGTYVLYVYTVRHLAARGLRKELDELRRRRRRRRRLLTVGVDACLIDTCRFDLIDTCPRQVCVPEPDKVGTSVAPAQHPGPHSLSLAHVSRQIEHLDLFCNFFLFFSRCVGFGESREGRGGGVREGVRGDERGKGGEEGG